MEDEMDYNLEDLIDDIRRQFPTLQILMRTTFEGEDRDCIGGKWFAHLHGEEQDHNGYVQSFRGVGDTAFDALHGANSAAHREMTPAKADA